ncbi:MAG: ABC transporter substrate-binding protein [Firmicutes bacterium]|nr:ABC transporter substrate-binding protein [Bacillota bacterium]
MKRAGLVKCISLILAIFLLAVGFAACGKKEAPKAEPKAEPAKEQPAAAPKAEPEKPKVLKKIKYTYYPVAHTTALYVAAQEGFFAEEGLEVEFVKAGSTPDMINAVLAGEAQISNSSLPGLVNLAIQGREPIGVYNLVWRHTMETVMLKETADRLGISRNDSIEKRVKALKGLRIATAGPGSEADILYRLYLKEAGLDPDKDVTMTTIKGLDLWIAALKTKQVDTFSSSPPGAFQPVVDGYGVLYISNMNGDLPALQEHPYQTVWVLKSWAKDHEEEIVSFVRAAQKATDFMFKNKDKAIKDMSAYMPPLDDKAMSMGYDSFAQGWSKDGRTTQKAMQAAMDVLFQTGSVKEKISTAEGGLWTNSYIDKAEKK